jgi:chromosome segregation ATPase
MKSAEADPMDENLHQLIQRIDWMDKERQKDKQEISKLIERLAGLEKEKSAMEARLKQMDADITKAVTSATRVNSVDGMLDQVRLDVNKRVEQLELRRADSDREQERLRTIDREASTRALADLRRPLEALPRLEQDILGRKEEERRISKLVAELQQSATEIVRRDDERLRALAALEEARRQDAKRVVDLQTELPELRKRGDENKSKLEILEDMVRRNDLRVGEVVTLENDRRMSQMAWMEQQQVAAAERERSWNDLRQRADAILRSTEDYGHRMETYAETHRQMKKTIEEYYVNLERIDRRINEAGEIQRLAEERFKQEWNAFLADEQKRWTTHMLLRDEQWRDNDRLLAKLTGRIENAEEQLPDLRETLRGMQAIDQARLQSIYTVIREMMAEYDQTMVKAR